jgi:Phospholipase B
MGMRDATNELMQQGYFASYNTASDPFIFNISGWQPMVQQYGALFTYDKCPRALIFARDAPKVETADDMARIMRYNDYTQDPLSRMDCRKNPPYSATEAIASRGDLDPNSGDWVYPGLFGLEDNLAVDAKFTSTSMMAGTVPSLREHYAKKGSLKIPAGNTFYARGQSGPTHDQVPVFDWRNTNLTNAAFGFDTLHLGQPDVFNFTWVTFSATQGTTAASGAEVGEDEL